MWDMQSNFNFTLNIADSFVIRWSCMSNNETWVLCPYLTVEQKLLVKLALYQSLKCKLPKPKIEHFSIVNVGLLNFLPQG